jgi:hypothetical protein
MMKRERTLLALILGLALGAVLVVGLTMAQESTPQDSVSTAFTYQGQLQEGGLLVDEVCDMAFRLYDQSADGSQVGDAITTTVPITNGLFTISLDFGASAFTGDARWLAVVVQCPDDLAWTDTVDGLHGNSLARIGRYYIPGGGGSVTIPIPHYNSFQISIGEAYASPQKAAWLTGIENDGRVAWVGIDSTGSVVTGNAALSSTDTVLTLGSDITLACPGNNNYELELTSTYEDVRVFIIW